MVDQLFRRRASDGVLVLTIDRPERRNAMSRAAWLELAEILREVRDSFEVRGLILTGAGDRAFSAGADVRELVDRDPAVTLDGTVHRILTELEDVPLPTVAALNGDALGGGWELALACDLRVAVSSAKVGFPEVGLGIMPGAGGTQRLLQHLGLGRAKELILAGRLLSASEAFHLGLINRVVENGNVLATARELLDEVLAQAPPAVRLAKAVLNATARVERASELERLAYALTFYSEERTERMRRFLERPTRSRDGE